VRADNTQARAGFDVEVEADQVRARAEALVDSSSLHQRQAARKTGRRRLSSSERRIAADPAEGPRPRDFQRSGGGRQGPKLETAPGSGIASFASQLCMWPPRSAPTHAKEDDETFPARVPGNRRRAARRPRSHSDRVRADPAPDSKVRGQHRSLLAL